MLQDLMLPRPHPATLSRKRLWHRCMFPVKFCEIFKNTGFRKHLRATATAYNISLVLATAINLRDKR